MRILKWSGLLRMSPLVCLLACAVPQTPTGGPKDTEPPRILDEESTPNRQTSFSDREIVVTFDEWIQLRDIYNQLIISPPMPAEPDVKLKGKSMIVTLPDSLRANTTYTLHFGNAIEDLNESNKLENFSFVFSTGPALDSANVSGMVIDAVTSKPAEGMWVMLYPVAEDSAVYRRKPDYIAKTSKSGTWSIDNIREDSFQVLALKDDNLNYLFDQETEWLGWLAEPVMTGSEPLRVPDMLISPRDRPVRIQEALHAAPGWIKCAMIASAGDPGIRFEPALPEIYRILERDTLHIFYDRAQTWSGIAILEGDTTRIRQAAVAIGAVDRLRVAPVLNKLFPGSPVELVADVPLTGVDTSRISLVHDSLGALPVRVWIDSLNRRKVRLTAPWQSPEAYTLTLDTGAFTDIWDRGSDSLTARVNMPGYDKFGEMILQPAGLDSTRQYLLYIKSGEQILETFRIEGVSSTTLRKPGLPPARLTIEIVEDLNRNGRWDTGHYPDRRQPERRQVFTPDNLRAGWEVEVSLTWK